MSGEEIAALEALRLWGSLILQTEAAQEHRKAVVTGAIRAYYAGTSSVNPTPETMPETVIAARLSDAANAQREIVERHARKVGAPR